MSVDINMGRHNLTSESGLKWKRVLNLARKRGILRPRDLEDLGIAREYLNKLHAEGLLERIGRGLYRLPDAEVGRFSQLAEVAKRVPKGVICLISALDFHELTTQIPHQIWLAIPPKDRAPRIQYPPLRIVRFAEGPLRFGVETHSIDGVDVKVFSAGKTVTDCFKFRSQVGLDVALEALRDCYRQKKATMDELWEAAKVCRMTNVMRPYLESLV
jgi:predicted transcriptional regulator of viral defense system